MEQKQDRAERARLTHGVVDAIFAFFVFSVGAVMIIDNYQIGAGWAEDGPESGYFPLRIGVILCLASVVVMLRTLSGQGQPEIFVSRARFKLVLLVLIPTMLYVLAIKVLGIYVASALFVGAFMRVMDRSGWPKTLLVSIGANLLLFWLFEMQFMVPLPKGPLEALLGY